MSSGVAAGAVLMSRGVDNAAAMRSVMRVPRCWPPDYRPGGPRPSNDVERSKGHGERSRSRMNGFKPDRHRAHLRLMRQTTLLLMCLVCLPAMATGPQIEEVSFESRGVTVAGSIVLPEG